MFAKLKSDKNILLDTVDLKESMFWSAYNYFIFHHIKQNKTKQTKLQYRNNYNTRWNQIDQFLSKQPGERMLLYIAKDLKVLV